MSETQTQATSQTTAVQQAAGTVELGTNDGDAVGGEEFDVLSLIEDDAATVETPAQKPEPKPESVKPDEAAAAVGTTEQPPAHQPGTPDKAVQKLQQDLSATNRAISELLQLAKAGQSLSPEQKQQVQQQQRKLDVIREKLAAKEDDKKFDPFDDGAALAETVIEQDETIRALEQRLAKVEQGTSAQDDAAVFAALAAKYPGVDVKSVWDKAVESAAEIIGADNPKLENLADRIFHQRSLAAANSVRAKAGRQEQQTTAPNATPGAARVTVQTGVAPAAPLSEEEEYRRNALSLVD